MIVYQSELTDRTIRAYLNALQLIHTCWVVEPGEFRSSVGKARLDMREERLREEGTREERLKEEVKKEG